MKYMYKYKDYARITLSIPDPYDAFAHNFLYTGLVPFALISVLQGDAAEAPTRRLDLRHHPGGKAPQ